MLSDERGPELFIHVQDGDISACLDQVEDAGAAEARSTGGCERLFSDADVDGSGHGELDLPSADDECTAFDLHIFTVSKNQFCE